MTATTSGARAVDDLRAAFRDEPAFRAWYGRALPRVYSFIAARCGGPGALAEELTQQTFVEAVRHVHRYDGRADVITWLCAIARHKLADHYRRLEREERRRRPTVAEIDPGAGDTALAALQERDAIERALRCLPAAQRAALLFHHLDGMSVGEVASEMGRSGSAVESLLARARENFRRCYEGRTGG
jgi:RNA polymerase sigma-70 factor (ECF subfamily)